MYVFIFTTVVVGFAAAGVVMLLFRLWGRKAPKYVIPFVAALAMFGYMIWDDYTWYQRTIDRLPSDVAVTMTFEHVSAIAPWTLVKPVINSFTVVDKTKIVQSPVSPDIKLAMETKAIKNGETRSLSYIIDCLKGRAAILSKNDPRDENGFPTDMTEWFDMDADDPLRAAVCQ
ncbi:hypothetical protein [Thalassospira povalilytica]|uniref:hypothetical protein n=1 Tax=Thalassospira povalilytica TaxID=732237 RepID=UPI003AA9CA3F